MFRHICFYFNSSLRRLLKAISNFCTKLRYQYNIQGKISTLDTGIPLSVLEIVLRYCCKSKHFAAQNDHTTWITA